MRATVHFPMSIVTRSDVPGVHPAEAPSTNSTKEMIPKKDRVVVEEEGVSKEWEHVATLGLTGVSLQKKKEERIPQHLSWCFFGGFLGSIQ